MNKKMMFENIQIFTSHSFLTHDRWSGLVLNTLPEEKEIWSSYLPWEVNMGSKNNIFTFYSLFMSLSRKERKPRELLSK